MCFCVCGGGGVFGGGFVFWVFVCLFFGGFLFCFVFFCLFVFFFFLGGGGGVLCVQHDATDSTKHARTSAIRHLVLSSAPLSEFTFDLGGG